MNTSNASTVPLTTRFETNDFPVLRSFEIFVTLVTIVNAIIMIRAFIKVKTLHIYFRTVSFNLFGFAILRSGNRLVYLINSLMHLISEESFILYYVSILNWFFGLTMNFGQVSFIIERAMSSLHDYNYEFKNNKVVMCGYVLLPAIAASLPIVSTYEFKILDFYVYLWFSVGFNLSMTILFVTFLKLYSWKCSKNRRSWALSTRYQREENSRVSVTMKWFGFFCSLQNALVTGFCLWILFRDDASSSASEINWLPYAITDFLLSVSTALYPIPFIATIEHIRRMYLQTFCCKEIKSNKINVNIEKDKTLNRNLYFRQLRAQWNGNNEKDLVYHDILQ
uniref:G_PROTEIN_RECEP_F1_2 domain-containing protein n=1 Tax=Panagrellus redivivus TaxID=6233 RepID=A0A7E4WE49_PANRE